jgi:hypothetical protein
MPPGRWHRWRHAALVGLAMGILGPFLAMLGDGARPGISTPTAAEGPEIGAYMVRNAYHFATLYHAARAAQWELAAYEAEEVGETLEDAAAATTVYAPLLRQYVQNALRPLRQALEAQDARRFQQAFQAAVRGCNTCHTATRHAFIVVPAIPPQLSIFTFAPRAGE